MSIEAKVNANKLHDQARKDVEDFWKNASIDSALIINANSQPVTFYVYNYIDSIYAISAMKTQVAPSKNGKVAASGAFFKVHPNDKADQQFLVAPGKAYRYKGPGDVEEVVQ